MIEAIAFFKDNWKLIALILIVCAAYVKGCTDEKGRFDEFKEQVEAAGEAQRAKTRATNDANRKAQKEIDNAHKESIARLSVELDAAIAKLRKDAGRRIVPAARARPGEPVPSACFDADRLNAGIAEGVQRLLGRLAGLIQRGEEGLDAAKWWREWGAKVGTCR